MNRSPENASPTIGTNCSTLHFAQKKCIATGVFFISCRYFEDLIGVEKCEIVFDLRKTCATIFRVSVQFFKEVHNLVCA